MKKLIILLGLSFVMYSKPKQSTNFRVKVTQIGRYTVYVPQYKHKAGLFNVQWRTVDEGSWCMTLKEAESIINDLKFEDSVRTAHRKLTYIYY